MRTFTGIKEHLRPHALPVALLCMATLLAYAHSLGHEFLTNWDDAGYVTANEAVRGFTLSHLKAAFTKYYVSNYAPVHIISYMVDYTVWGMRAAGFILTNIVIHAVNGLLFYALLIRHHGRRLLAVIASFIFLLHPVQVESVVWISQRKNVLAMLFFLLSLHLYIIYRRREGNSLPVYISSVILFVAALLTKSVTVILPAVLLLYDICFIKKEHRPRWIADKIPFAVATAAVVLIALESQSGHSLEVQGGRADYHGGSPAATFYTMLPVFVRYLRMVFWPDNLTAAYDVTIRTGIDATVVFSALALLGVCLYCILRFHRNRDEFFWIVVFFVGLLPVSQIIPMVTLINDRYLYFPMLGVSAFLGIVAVRLVDSVKIISQKTALIIIAIVLALLPFLSWSQSRIWSNSLTLWQDVTAKEPRLSRPWKALGETYERRGRSDLALIAYQRALAIDPLFPEVLNNIGILYMKGGDFTTSRIYLEKLIATRPDYSKGHLSLGRNYYDSGNIEKAAAAYRNALVADPRSVQAMIALGNISLKNRDLEAAGDFFTRASHIEGNNAEVEYNLACLNALEGRHSKAVQHLETAVRLGFRNGGMMRRDPYLRSLSGLPEFEKLLHELSLPVRHQDRK